MPLEWPIGSAIVGLGIGAGEPVGVVGVDPRDASCGAERPAVTALVELGLDAEGRTGSVRRVEATGAALAEIGLAMPPQRTLAVVVLFIEAR